MKKLLKNALIIALPLLSACGKNGRTGNVYVAVESPTTNCYYLTSYSDNNVDIPSVLVTGDYYQSYAGTYSYDYYVSSSCGYSDYHCWGSYTLNANSGSAGGFFSDGKDGSSRYYDLFCEWSGMDSRYSRMMNRAPIKIDTSYITHGNRMEIHGYIQYGVKKPAVVVNNKLK